MVFPSQENFEKCVEEYKNIIGNNKPSAKLFDTYIGNIFNQARYLWKEERCRLQGISESYVKNLSEKDAADLLGDGWTVDVIAHILKNIKDGE